MIHFITSTHPSNPQQPIQQPYVKRTSHTHGDFTESARYEGLDQSTQELMRALWKWPTEVLPGVASWVVKRGKKTTKHDKTGTTINTP